MCIWKKLRACLNYRKNEGQLVKMVQASGMWNEDSLVCQYRGSIEAQLSEQGGLGVDLENTWSEAVKKDMVPVNLQLLTKTSGEKGFMSLTHKKKKEG